MTLEKLKKHCGTYFANLFQSQVKNIATSQGNSFYSMIVLLESLKYAVLQIDKKDIDFLFKQSLEDLTDFEIKFVVNQNDFYVFKLVYKFNGNGFLELL